METNTTPTIAEILDRYQAECLPRLAPRTARDYVRHIRDLKRWYGTRHFIASLPQFGFHGSTGATWLNYADALYRNDRHALEGALPVEDRVQ